MQKKITRYMMRPAQKKSLVNKFPGRYYRSLLIAGGIAVSISLLAVAIVAVLMIGEELLDERKHNLMAKTDEIRLNLARYQARLKQTIEAYEILRDLGENKKLPIQSYRENLMSNHGYFVTKNDLTALPMAIFSKENQPNDSGQLAMFLRLIRQVSPSVLLRSRENGYEPHLFIYTTDRSMLALTPLPSFAQLSGLSLVEKDQVIDEYVKFVEDVIARSPAEDVRKQRIVWIPVHTSPFSGMVAQYAVPMYQGDKRIAVVVASLPINLFQKIIQNSVHVPGYFFLARDLRNYYGVDETAPRERAWLENILTFSDTLDKKSTIPVVRYRNGVLFLTLFIPGPEWTAVYALDWYDVLFGLYEKTSSILIATCLTLILLWLFIVVLIRLFFEPMQIQSQLVFESEAFNRAILDTAPMGLTIYDPVIDSVVMQNAAAQNLLGDSASRLSFYYSLIYPAPYDGTRNQFDFGMIDSKVCKTETCIVGSRGEQKELAVYFSKTRHRQREVILFAFTDISEQKTTVRLLQKAKDAAENANKAKSMFLAIMSHEIRTPLHGALGNLELLDLEVSSSRQKERVVTIRTAFDALLSLINDILDLSKIEASELSLNSEFFRLDELVEKSAQTFAPVILNKKLKFLCLIDPQVGGFWLGDENRINQVIMNLLSNAQKFTESGTITLRVTPGELIDSGRWIRVSVSDTGIGIADSSLRQIFEPFVQADQTTSYRFGGTGIGLTLCRRIVTLMGGVITVDSELGVGSIFTVDLPLKKDSTRQSDCNLLKSSSFNFSKVIVVCESPIWMLTIIAQIKSWSPDLKIVEVQSSLKISAGDLDSIIIFASFTDSPEKNWNKVISSCLDAIIIFPEGPLYPERSDNLIKVSSLCMAALNLAMISCGDTIKPLQQMQVNAERPQVRSWCKILVAEDEPLNRVLLEEQLCALGYENFDCVHNGKDAFEKCLSNEYDVIITDLSMPVFGGEIFIQKIRALGIKTPVIVTTAGIIPHGEVDETFFSALLHKPVTLYCLKSALEKVLISSKEFSQNECASTENLKAIELQQLFLDGWASDELGLFKALKANSVETFLLRIHRLKGALLVLSEKHAVQICDELQVNVSLQGIQKNRGLINSFIEVLRSIIDKYQKNISETKSNV